MGKALTLVRQGLLHAWVAFVMNEAHRAMYLRCAIGEADEVYAVRYGDVRGPDRSTAVQPVRRYHVPGEAA